MAKVTLDLRAVDAMASKAARGGVQSVLGEAETILKTDILNRPGTGRRYGKHRASAPGQPPAPDLGNLRALTNANPALRETDAEVAGDIEANAAYAEALSRGTERMAARPFFDLLTSLYRDRLQRAFEKGARS